MLTEGAGGTYSSADAALVHYYANATEYSRSGDEFVTPSRIAINPEDWQGNIRDNDAVIFFNYRGDRPREITKAFVYSDEQLATEPNGGFKRTVKPQNLYFATMTAYETGLPIHAIFDKPEKMHEIFGMYLAENGLKQFRSAETEKFPHVTFFFNDYREPPFDGENRGLAPSDKTVTTYDQKPEMSAHEVTDIIMKDLKKVRLMCMSSTNGDMVGHTGNLPAAKAETSMNELGKFWPACNNSGASPWCWPTMATVNKCGTPSTTAPTPAIPRMMCGLLWSMTASARQARRWLAADVAHEDAGSAQPPEMTGRSLIA